MDVQWLIEKWGVNNTVFVTITFDMKVWDKKEVYRLFNNFRTRAWVGAGISEAVKFIEEHDDGSLHIHIVGNAGADVRTGFDFAAFEAARKLDRRGCRRGRYYKLTRAYGASASPRLRWLWAYFRKMQRKYKNIGRISVEPLKGNAAAAAFYLAKYLTTGYGATVYRLKGLHRVEYLGCTPNHSTQFTRATPKGWARRQQLKRWAKAIGYDSLDALREHFKGRDGKMYWNKLAHAQRALIYSSQWFGREDVFPTLAHAQAAGMDCGSLPVTAVQISGLRPKLDYVDELRQAAKEAWAKGDQEEAQDLWRTMRAVQNRRQTQFSDAVSQDDRSRWHELAVQRYRETVKDMEQAAEKAQSPEALRAKERAAALVQGVVNAFGGKIDRIELPGSQVRR